MSNPIQNIENIVPLSSNNQGSKAVDIVEAEYLEGKALLERGEFGLAAVALHNALIGYEEKKNNSGIANASNQLGHLCLRRQEYDKAMQHYQRAEEICKTLNDPMSLLALSKQFILVYTGAGKYKEAISRCLDILDLYQANNNPKGTVEILEQIAEIYLQAENRTGAADAYRTISSIHKNFKHERIASEFLEKAATLEKAE